MLYQFLVENREAILELSRRRIARRPAPRPTPAELGEGVERFFDELVSTLRREAGIDARANGGRLGADAIAHGEDLLRAGFTVGQLIHDYGDLCQAITELAVTRRANIGTGEFRTLNRCLDDAMAEAVGAYERQRERDRAGLEVERLGVLAHELRNAMATGVLAFESLKKGRLEVGGKTGAVLGQSLMRLRAIVDRTLAEVRVDAGERLHTRFRLGVLVDEVALAAEAEAEARGVGFAVHFDPDVELDGDLYLLASALGNLLHNAVKFTRPRGNVSLTARAAGGRLAIEVADECGGLPPGAAEELFRPFAQEGADRSGLGLGLSISRRATEANGGRLRVRDLPGKGCVFTLDLPLAQPRAEAHPPP